MCIRDSSLSGHVGKGENRAMVAEPRYRALFVRGISKISFRARPHEPRSRHRVVKERKPVLILLRSIVFNVLFYLNTLVYLVIALPTFFMPYRAIIAVARSLGATNLVLLRVVAGIDIDVRGAEKIPKGAIIVAAKHQSAWETFALLPLFDNPVFIVKRALQWIPIFGWLMVKGRMVPVDRGAGSQALAAMIERARIELAQGRQLVIFPEGTRRPAGAAC